MSGKSIRVLGRNTYSVTAAQLPANQVWLFPVAVNVPSNWALYGTLALRCHAFSQGAGTGSSPGVRALAYPSAPTEEDPNVLYRGAAAVITGAKITGAATFVPSVAFDSNVTVGNLGPSLDILLEISQWGTTPGLLTVVVSCDLILKA
jgi:hypothetical protein